MGAVLRAAYGYLFLVFMVRVVGRRPGKQLTPFEYVLVFFMGGLMLTAMVAQEASLTNALCQIMVIAVLHAGIAWLRTRSRRFASLVDGTPLLLSDKGRARGEVLHYSRIAFDDVMASARDQGISNLDEVEYAVLERNGEISILPKHPDE